MIKKLMSLSLILGMIISPSNLFALGGEKIDNKANEEIELDKEENVNAKNVEQRKNRNMSLGVEYTSNINSTNTNDIYNLNLSSAGRLSINIKSYIYSSKFLILDEQGNEIYSSWVEYGYADSPKYSTHTIDLEPGKYKLKINRYSSNNGNYTIKATHSSANNNDTEPNNGMETSQYLPTDKTYTGFISRTDNVDYYKVNIPTSGKLIIDIKSYIYSSKFKILDQQGKELYSSWVEYGYSDNPKYSTHIQYLDPGKYYIVVSKYNNNTGKYTIKATHQSAGTNEIEPNNGMETAHQLKLNTTITGFISETDRIDYFKLSVPKSQKVKINYTSYIYDSYLTLYNSTGSQIFRDNIYYGSEDNPKKYSKEIDLQKGTYYIKITPYSSNHSGKYRLNVEANTDSFSDISGHWAKSYIEEFTSKGYLNGYADGTFRPNNQITRAEFIKVVNRAYGLTQKSNINFTDVKSGSWQYDEVRIGVKAGYISTGNTKFRPNDPITREEACKIVGVVGKISGDGIMSFKDKNKISSWAKKYVDGLSESKIINGYSDGTFKPQNNITRAETVKILSLASKK